MNQKELFSLIGKDYYKPNQISKDNKKCSICGRIKMVSRFCKNRKYSDGYHPWCKTCTIEINENRKIQKTFAKPEWLTEKQKRKMLKLEDEARKLSGAMGNLYAVAHKEPIQHWLICGLDIPENIYVDTQANNARFSNSFLPYRLLEDGTIKHIDLPLEFIKDAFNFNETFNKSRNEKYREMLEEKDVA